jgi:hypothetical protein
VFRYVASSIARAYSRQASRFPPSARATVGRTAAVSRDDGHGDASPHRRLRNLAPALPNTAGAAGAVRVRVHLPKDVCDGRGNAGFRDRLVRPPPRVRRRRVVGVTYLSDPRNGNSRSPGSSLYPPTCDFGQHSFAVPRSVEGRSKRRCRARTNIVGETRRFLACELGEIYHDFGVQSGLGGP